MTPVLWILVTVNTYVVDFGHVNTYVTDFGVALWVWCVHKILVWWCVEVNTCVARSGVWWWVCSRIFGVVMCVC